MPSSRLLRQYRILQLVDGRLVSPVVYQEFGRKYEPFPDPFDFEEDAYAAIEGCEQASGSYLVVPEVYCPNR